MSFTFSAFTTMGEVLLRILTPRRSTDILRDVHAAKEQGKPYAIIFVGVNAIGKSANLAKVAYLLLQHNVSVMMATCDTFRSDVVESLQTHARRLQGASSLACARRGWMNVDIDKIECEACGAHLTFPALVVSMPQEGTEAYKLVWMGTEMASKCAGL